MQDLLMEMIAPGSKVKANPHPCDQCPWRTANQGSPNDPHDFYTPANLARLWKGLREGERMSCHPTDSRMAEFEGYEHTADLGLLSECTGSLILAQRELWKFQQICEADPAPPNGKAEAIYRKANPKGLTRRGMIANVERLLWVPNGPNPELNQAGIGYAPLGDWEAVRGK